MGTWDPAKHEVWGYMLSGQWTPCVDKRSALALVENNPERKLAKRMLSAVEEVKVPKEG